MDRSHHPFEIEIEKLIFGGSGLGHYRGKVVFVPFSAQGDRLLVRKVREKGDYIQGEAVKVLAPAPVRVDPPCPYFLKCGGCHWQHIGYPHQVEAKRSILEEILYHRFPRVRSIPISMDACPEPFEYRSRARFQVRKSGEKSIVGFFRPGSHLVEDIKHCILLRPLLNRALSSLRQSLPPRGMGIREYEVAGSCEDDLWDSDPAFPEASTRKSPKDTAGKGSKRNVPLNRKVGEFRYSFSPSVFFQANDFLITRLVEIVYELAADSGRGTALDLFAGAGLFSLPLAAIYNSVIAVENSPAASEYCSRNAAAAGTNRIRTVCADVELWLEAYRAAAASTIDLILLDPPRTGAGRRVMEHIQTLLPRTVLYVSCDPQTLSRDLGHIDESKYSIDRIEGLDMFPQTFHFETVVCLTRR